MFEIHANKSGYFHKLVFVCRRRWKICSQSQENIGLKITAFFRSTKWLAAKLKAVDLQRLFFVASFSYCQLKASCMQPTVKSFFPLAAANSKTSLVTARRATDARLPLCFLWFSLFEIRATPAVRQDVGLCTEATIPFQGRYELRRVSRTRNRLREKLKGNHANRYERVFNNYLIFFIIKHAVRFSYANQLVLLSNQCW